VDKNYVIIKVVQSLPSIVCCPSNIPKSSSDPLFVIKNHDNFIENIYRSAQSDKNGIIVWKLLNSQFDGRMILQFKNEMLSFVNMISHLMKMDVVRNLKIFNGKKPGNVHNEGNEIDIMKWT